ncbi:hypothetical protein HPB47_018685 [Ixodes persulcatus]|uniref:Uncharacterized protein n=1 Tax=Ixodes persulcatus TaxID=34615 RepID=A0AC60QM18_IXOPE|nr:hypothetical protein HPB47_018685 [Ixodes persulcatus]
MSLRVATPPGYSRHVTLQPKATVHTLPATAQYVLSAPASTWVRNWCDNDDVEANPGLVRTPLSMSEVAAGRGYSDCFPQNFQQRSYAQFNSEEVCSLRKMAGGNDCLDARAVTFSLERILRTGNLCPSQSSNVENGQAVLSRQPFL